jgi:hypothetical protein
MNAQIYKTLQSALLFTDAEYKQWKQIIELQEKSEHYLEHIRIYMLSIHYNSARDFINKFVGNYSNVEMILAPGFAQITYFSPGFSSGVCGMRLAISRDRIEVSRMQAQDQTMVAGLLTKVPVG